MRIEEVSIEDIESLKQIARSAIHESVDASIDIKREILIDTENHIDNHISGVDRIFLKCAGSTTLGFILVQKFWNLSDLYVLPTEQGNGVGRQLIDEARAVCINQGMDFMRVNSSLNAEGFYRKLGFVSHTPQSGAPDFVVPLIYKF